MNRKEYFDTLAHFCPLPHQNEYSSYKSARRVLCGESAYRSNLLLVLIATSAPKCESPLNSYLICKKIR